MQKPLDTLLQKEMSRKEFLAVMGLGVASIMGLSGIISTLTGRSLGNHRAASSGYGSSAYGGNKKA